MDSSICGSRVLRGGMEGGVFEAGLEVGTSCEAERLSGQCQGC